MSIPTTEELPGGTTREELQTALRGALGRPRLVVDSVSISDVVHTITAPSTESLSRVRVAAHDSEPLEIPLIAKCLQTALRGLPPQIPGPARERIAAGIPWRLEAEVYAADTAERMPPGLRLPRLYAAFERPDERIALWLEDVEPLEGPWGTADLARAATLLGRLTVRRADQALASLPRDSFLAGVTRGLGEWAFPAICGEDLWAHPAFVQADVARLRQDLVALVPRVGELFAALQGVPWWNTHGDPTPMNLLRPSADPTGFVLIDWGTASPGPVGWDVVPLVFGPAENGTAAPSDLPERLAEAVPAYEAGLAEEGVVLPCGAVGDAVRRAALLRYPFSSLPIGDVLGGSPVTDDLLGHARRKAAFVDAVLDVCGGRAEG